jgi:hypothetical protein
MDFWAHLCSFMYHWSDVWSFLTAIGTVGMTVATYAIIRQGKHQREDARQQHRDRFKPICILMPYNGVDPWNKRCQLIEKIDPSPDNPSFGTLAIKCVLRNVGTGPALKLRIKFRFPDMKGWTTEPWELSPLGAGESRGGENTPLLVPVRIDDQFTGFSFASMDFYTVTGKLWEIWLEYEDVFGRRFCAVHHKKPVQAENQKPIPGSADRRGLSPMYYSPPRPWVAFPKNPES